MKSLLAAAAILASVSAAEAQRGRQYEDWDGNRLRTGAGCMLELFGQRVAGTCDILRRSNSANTFIEVGNSIYLIKRDGTDRWSKSSADFFQVTPEGQPNRYITSVQARGSCWVGEGVRFCAR
jgi:hypothetical protein